jgi:ATP-dependent protease ClpP protease subunit
MKKPTVSIVLGGGHSIGVPLAVSAKHSFIVPSATMTIHPIRTSGVIIGVHQTFDYLAEVQEQICSFVERNSKISAENFLSIMLETENIANDVGTVLFGEEAVECGLIDSVGGLGDAIELLQKMKEKDF